MADEVTVSNRPATPMPTAQPDSPPPSPDLAGALLSQAPTSQALSDVLQQPTPNPNLAPPRRQNLPGIVNLIASMIKPPMVAQPGELARPVSRMASFEDFLGNFMQAMGQGFSNAGSGPGSFSRGFAGAFNAPLIRQQQQQAIAQQQAQTQETQARATLTQRQADLAGQMVTIPTSYGPISMPLSAAQQFLKGGFAAGVNAQAGVQKEQIAAQNKLDVVSMQQAAQAGTVSKMVPDMGQDGKPFYHVYNKFGKEIGQTSVNVIPQLMTSTSSTVEYKEDANGNIVALPKTTTTSKIPPSLQQKVPALANAPAPAANNPQVPRSGFPRPAGAITARPVTTPDGQPLAGKSGGDSVYGIDPQSGQTMLSTRANAGVQGLQGVRKVTDSTIRADMHDTRVLNDISAKANNVIDSAAALDQEMQQKAIIANALEASAKDNQFAVGISHTNLPLSAFNQLMSAHGLLGSEAATQQSRDYIVNVLSLREAAMGLQKVLTGSARSNETQLSALLNTLPGLEPDPALARQKLAAFTQNIQMLREGIPSNLGIQVVPLKQILQPQQQQQNPPATAPASQGSSIPGEQFVERMAHGDIPGAAFVRRLEQRFSKSVPKPLGK